MLWPPCGALVDCLSARSSFEALALRRHVPVKLMEAVTRYLNVAYLTMGVIASWLFVKTAGWLMAGLGPRADRILFADIQLSVLLGVVIGAGATYAAYNNEKVYNWSTEVAVELSKVTWPNQEDTIQNTKVVIAFAVVVAGVLSLFDFLWKFVTDMIL